MHMPVCVMQLLHIYIYILLCSCKKIFIESSCSITGPPDEIDVIVSTRNEFIYDVVLPVLLQRPVKLRISYVDASRQDTSDGILTTTEYNDTRSIIYREVDTGQLPFERYFVRISIVAEFGNRRVEGPALTSSELVGKSYWPM